MGVASFDAEMVKRVHRVVTEVFAVLFVKSPDRTTTSSER
jgi:hypothetical protein